MAAEGEECGKADGKADGHRTVDDSIASTEGEECGKADGEADGQRTIDDSIASTSAGGSEADWSLQSGRKLVLAPADSSSEASSSSHHRLTAAAMTGTIDWEHVWLGSKIKPLLRYARCMDDIHLLACFLELAELKDIDGEAVKLLLRTLKFLRLCDYAVEDICSVLAHASAYFPDAWALCGADMDASEVGYILVTLTFVAHCYVQDETCPLHIWHQHLFRKYCPLKTLNAAVVQLLHIRGYMLRLKSEDLHRRNSRLLKSVRRALKG